MSECRTRHQLERRVRRERIPRECDAEHLPARIGNRRCPRLHADAPEETLRTKRGHDTVHNVLLANGYTARGQKEIHFVRIGSNHRCGPLHIIGYRADNRHLRTELLQSPCEEIEIAVVDLPGAERLSRLKQLIARTRDRDAYPPTDKNITIPLACKYRQMRCPDALPAADEYRILLDILARIAVVLVRFGRERNVNPLPVLLHILLPHHTVAALRNRAARHDADALARADRTREEIARALLANHAQRDGMLRRGICRTRRRKCIAVERRAVERRIVKARAHIL